MMKTISKKIEWFIMARKGTRLLSFVYTRLTYHCVSNIIQVFQWFILIFLIQTASGSHVRHLGKINAGYIFVSLLCKE